MSSIQLDHAVLLALQEVMEGDFPVLLATYMADSVERLQQIKSAYALADCQALRLAAHSFKGSCGNLGAGVLAGLCKQLEEVARDERLAEAPPLIQRIEQEFVEVRALLAQDWGLPR